MLGTYPAMAPDSWRGARADARSDIFAFGAMSTDGDGHRAFEGRQRRPSSVRSSTRIPAVSTLQSLAPPGLDRLVARCLAKDPDDRWQTARDLMLELKWLAEPVSAAADPRSGGHRANTKWMRVMFAALATLVVTGAAHAGHARHVPAGRSGRAGDVLASRRVDSGPGRRAGCCKPFHPTAAACLCRHRHRWQEAALDPPARFARCAGLAREPTARCFPSSPDSRARVLRAGEAEKRFRWAGGPPQVLCDAVQPRGGTWGAGNAIVFSAGAGYELYSVPAGGGVANALAADGSQPGARPAVVSSRRPSLRVLRRPQSFGTHAGVGRLARRDARLE